MFVLTVDGTYGPEASLNDYLRLSGLSPGTKVFCKQGGCGVCIVVAKIPRPGGEPPLIANINSVRIMMNFMGLLNNVSPSGLKDSRVRFRIRIRIRFGRV